MYLEFLARESKDGKERAQARHEIEIAHRKMARARLHPNYEQEAATRGIVAIKKEWGL